MFQSKEVKMLKSAPLILCLIYILLNINCSKTPDVSGKYQKIDGDYRYDSIVIEKAEKDEYTITAFDKDKKKISATSKLEGKTMGFGWLSSLIFKNDYKEFVLHVGNGSTFRRIDN